MFRKRAKNGNYAVYIRPLDLLWLDIDPNDGCGGIIVPRIPETWAEVDKVNQALMCNKCKLRGYVPREIITKDKYFFIDNYENNFIDKNYHL